MGIANAATTLKSCSLKYNLRKYLLSQIIAVQDITLWRGLQLEYALLNWLVVFDYI